MSQNLTEYLARRANGNGNASRNNNINKSNGGDTKEKSSEVQDKKVEPTRSPKWDDDVDTLKEIFDKTGLLPPPLSPTLPAKYGDDLPKFDIPRMLSPTLPDIYNEKKAREEAREKDNELRKIGKDDLRQPVPTRPQRPSKLDLDKDEDAEVLPNKPIKRKSFEKIENYGLHQVRFVEKGDNKALFVTLHVPSYYKGKRLKKTGSTTKLQGLGIKQGTQAGDRSPEKVRPTEPRAIKKSVFNTSTVGSPSSSIASSFSTKSTVSTSKSTTSNSNTNSSSNSQDHHSTPSSSSSTSSATDHQSLKTQNEKYLKIAGYKKHRGDELREKDLKLALTYFMDSLIIYLVGFNYEDQSRRVSKKLFSDKLWLSLLSLIDHTLRLSKENGIDDVAGVCLQIKAVVYEHVCNILGEFIQLKIVKRKQAKTDADLIKIDDGLVNHYKNLHKYRDLAKQSFVESDEYLSIFQLQDKYPSIYRLFKKQGKLKDQAERNKGYYLKPNEDSIHLPINTGVTLKEICAYSLKVMKQWCEYEKIRYDDWSF